MFEFNVSKDMQKKGWNKGGDNRKVAAHLCLTLIIKKLKISVEHGRVVITLVITKH